VRLTKRKCGRSKQKCINEKANERIVHSEQPVVTKQGNYQNKQRMVSMASDNAGFWCAKYDTIRYEMLFYRALKSRHESA